MHMSIAFVALAALLLNTPALARSQPCAPRKKIVKRLAERFKELPVALGMAANGAVLEILSAGEDGTFSVLVSMPNGVSCLLANGKHFGLLPTPTASRVVPGKPS